MAIHRSRAASVGYLLRMSPEQREELSRVAAEHNMTVREWSMYRLLGVTELEHGVPGRKPKTPQSQQELPMTG